MDSDFKNLQVTVSQTAEHHPPGHHGQLDGRAAVKPGAPRFDFLQMMECYGDSATGPSPEGCEYGSPGMLGRGRQLTSIADRSGSTATRVGPKHHPATPARALTATRPWAATPTSRLRRRLRTADPTPPATRLRAPAGQFSIPFVPADNPASRSTQQAQPGSSTSRPVQHQRGAGGVHRRRRDRPAQFETLTAQQAPGTRLRRDGEQRPDPQLLAGHRAPGHLRAERLPSLATASGYFPTASSSTPRR